MPRKFGEPARLYFLCRSTRGGDHLSSWLPSALRRIFAEPERRNDAAISFLATTPTHAHERIIWMENFARNRYKFLVSYWSGISRLSGDLSLQQRIKLRF